MSSSASDRTPEPGTPLVTQSMTVWAYFIGSQSSRGRSLIWRGRQTSRRSTWSRRFGTGHAERDVGECRKTRAGWHRADYGSGVRHGQRNGLLSSNSHHWLTLWPRDSLSPEGPKHVSPLWTATLVCFPPQCVRATRHQPRNRQQWQALFSPATRSRADLL